MVWVAVVLGVCLLVIAAVLLWRFKDSQSGSRYLQQDLRRLSEDVVSLKDTLHTQLNDRLEKNQLMMLSSLQKQFSQSSKIIGDVNRSLAELKESNKQVVNITDELKLLQNVLQNPKQRGVLGEYYLQSVLENVLPPDRYKLQYQLGPGDDGRELICDAVIFLPKTHV